MLFKDQYLDVQFMVGELDRLRSHNVKGKKDADLIGHTLSKCKRLLYSEGK